MVAKGEKEEAKNFPAFVFKQDMVTNEEWVSDQDAIASFMHLDREKWEVFAQGRAGGAWTQQVHTKVIAFCGSAGWKLNTQLDK